MENHWVQIRSGRSNTKMVGMARANYPQLPVFPTAGVIKLPSTILRTLIAKTIFAISNEESRYTLNGALMVLKPESIIMVATDGHRLAAHRELDREVCRCFRRDEDPGPKKAMAEINTLLQGIDDASIEFAKDDSTLFSASGRAC